MPASSMIRLRPTLVSDLDAVVAIEQAPANRPFITPWARPQHEGAIRIPDFRHFIVERGEGDGRQGFVILQGCRNPQHSVELKRQVLRPEAQQQGLGRACVRRLKALAFDQLQAHRFWLDVKSRNTRALALYLSEGFVEEGRLRESVRVDDPEAAPADGPRYDSLVVMSLLDREYEDRRALGLETPAPVG
jgi:diamine N-acetyltransferase